MPNNLDPKRLETLEEWQAIKVWARDTISYSLEAALASQTIQEKEYHRGVTEALRGLLAEHWNSKPFLQITHPEN